MKLRTIWSFSNSKYFNNSLVEQKIYAKQWCCDVLPYKRVIIFLIQITCLLLSFLPTDNMCFCTFPKTSFVLIRMYQELINVLCFLFFDKSDFSFSQDMELLTTLWFCSAESPDWFNVFIRSFLVHVSNPCLYPKNRIKYLIISKCEFNIFSMIG